MTDHVKTRNRLKSIPSIQSFDSLLNSCTITEEDKEILRLHYLKGKPLQYIADILGYSESTIRKKHAKALKKIAKLF